MSSSTSDYKLRRQVEGIILSHGGVIFGGHVRDVVLRETHAAAYYDALAHSGEDDIYDDPTFHDKYSGRTVVSSDIDCFMVSHSMEGFMDNLDTARISVTRVFERDDAKEYLPALDVPPGILKHVRYRLSYLDKHICAAVQKAVSDELNEHAVSMLGKEIQSFKRALHNAIPRFEPFNLDIMVASCYDFYTMYPPFGSFDFECNALLLTRHGITLSPSVHVEATILQRNEHLQRIIADISKKKAVYVQQNIPEWRIKNMREKGWSVATKHVQVIAHAPEEKDVCVICHEDLCGKHFRLPCCKSLYHKECMIRILSSEYGHKCIVCGRESDAPLDIAIVKNE
jgi:hypothetical protein